MHTFFTDVRLALRSLVKHPGFASVAVLTIALGVGANTAVFSVVNAVLLQPLPYEAAERLAIVHETTERAEVERRSVSYPNFTDWQREARAFDGMSAISDVRFTMFVGGVPERLSGELVSSGYFAILGISPARGRAFTVGDDHQGAPPVVLISDALWERAFNRDPDAIGRSVRVDEELATIVGVMPPGFTGVSDAAQVWAPIGRFAGAELLNARTDRWISSVVARLRDGVTVNQAQDEMAALAARIDAEFPSPAGRRGARVIPLRDELFGQVKPMLAVLLGAVGLVLLIACVNVANLLLVRGSGRTREIAVRRALGAHNGRIVRQLLTESVTLAAIGGAAGLLAASWSIDAIVAFSPVTLPSFARIGLDAPVLMFTLAVCTASGLLFGVVPALSASRSEILEPLKSGGRDDGGAGSARLRRGLVTAEVALALVLLVGAGLMLRTLDRMHAVDPGFRPDGLLSIRVALPAEGVDADAMVHFASDLLARLRALPGVVSASLSSDVPLGTSSSATLARLDQRAEPVRIYRHAVSPGHFQTLGVALLAGRDFTAFDGRSADQRIAIVSEAMARRYWAGDHPVGKRFLIGKRPYEIVGVVDNVQHRQLLEPATADPDVYFPLFQVPAQAFAILARVSGDREMHVRAIRATVAAINGDVPVFEINTGESLLASQTSRARFSGVLLGVFAVVALALTVVGIYGVAAYTVSRQSRQIGIRMALGATGRDIMRLVLTTEVTFIVAGIAVGTLAAAVLTRLLTSLIYGVTPTDPATFTAVALLLVLVGALACYVPARRAAGIDPVGALRAD